LNSEQEEKLLNACKTKNGSAQKALYQKYAPTMFGICLRYASDYHTAEDILQDGFVKVFRNIQKFRNDGSLEGWIKRIFVNTAIEQYRKSAKKYRFISLELVMENSFEDQKLLDLEHNELLDLIQRLPDGYRLVFNLYTIEGYTHEEIAKELQITIGTSKSQLARSKKYLRKLIQEQKASEERSLQHARSLLPGYV
jgi:RNA polymerase sigma-70 factor (ECF subfamily)